MKLSDAQRDLLKDIKKWGQISPDVEHAVGVRGAALDKVFAAIKRRGYIEGEWGGGIIVTQAGNDALAQSR
jgi:hypothetical protein